MKGIFNNKFNDIHGEYQSDNVININEAGIWYDHLPSSILAFKNESSTVAGLKNTQNG